MVGNDGAMGLRRIWTSSHGHLDHSRHCRRSRYRVAPTIRFLVMCARPIATFSDAKCRCCMSDHGVTSEMTHTVNSVARVTFWAGRSSAATVQARTPCHGLSGWLSQTQSSQSWHSIFMPLLYLPCPLRTPQSSIPHPAMAAAAPSPHPMAHASRCRIPRSWMTGIALGWIGSTIALGAVVRKP